jgi:hypothetical protein
MAGAIREGQETGEFRRDADADVAARMFVSSIMMQTLLQPRMAADEVAPIDGERLIDSAIELFLHSLRPVGVAVQPASSRTAVPLGDAKPEASLPAYGE